MLNRFFESNSMFSGTFLKAGTHKDNSGTNFLSSSRFVNQTGLLFFVKTILCTQVAVVKYVLVNSSVNGPSQ